MSMTLHLCIATGHNAANFIPLKQLAAQHVWILETPSMQARHSARALEMALKSKSALPQASVRVLPFDDSTPQTMRAAALQLADGELDGRDVIFHVTGGTKLMVMAIHQELVNIATGDGSYRVLYADTAHQVLNWLDEEPRQDAMADVLTLNEQLLLRGYRIDNDTRPAQIQQRASERAAVTRFMGEKSAQLKGFLGALNFFANKATQGHGLAQQFNYLPRGVPGKLLELAQEQGLLTIQEEWSQVTFANAEVAQYFSGGWVEEYVFLKFTGVLKPSQYTLGAQMTHSLTKSRNEIDGIAVANNRALVIECKAKRQDGDEASNAIYKLGQLVKQVGGLMARGLYVSARSVSETDRSRAREYGVDVLAAEELADLSSYLRRWQGAVS